MLQRMKVLMRNRV